MIPPPEFISEDDLWTFDGWLSYQTINMSTMTPDELATLRRAFDEARQRAATSPTVGLMKLQPVPGEHRYAVAVQEGSDLWLTLWVRRSRKGEFFVMRPVGDRDWDPHTSYHLDGTLHLKSYDRRMLPSQQRQPLTGTFQRREHLGSYVWPLPEGRGGDLRSGGLLRGCHSRAWRVGPATRWSHGRPGGAGPRANRVPLDPHHYQGGLS